MGEGGLCHCEKSRLNRDDEVISSKYNFFYMFGKDQTIARHASMIGLLLIILYAFCLVWSLTMTDPEVMKLHLLNLKLVFPGFKGFDALSIIWGAILSFVYGFVGSTIWHSLHKNCCK